MLTDFLGYGNHVGLFSEEISISGEGLGNTPQGFSAVVRPFHPFLCNLSSFADGSLDDLSCRL